MTPEPHGQASVDVSIRWLIGLGVACLVGVLGLKVFFDGLQDDLRAQSVNERARLFVGEEIVRGIHGIEKDMYLMAASNNLAAARRAGKNIERQLEKLRHDLVVLKDGGTVRRQVMLNIEGRDDMLREAEYQPEVGANRYVMELIEIDPLLDQVEQRSTELERLLSRVWAYQDKGDRNGFYSMHDEVDAFLKHMPPYFARLDENANRLFFDSSERLRDLEIQLDAQRMRLKQVEMGMMGLLVILTGLFGITLLKQIKAANERLSQAVDEMRLAKEEAERASRAKSEFVSRMSHELRTPLNAIIGFADILGTEVMSPAQKNYVSLINSSGKHLMELINAVLDHAKIESGSMTLERIAFDFPATIDSVRSIVLERARAKGLDFVADISDKLPHYVYGDPTRLRQVLINLLVNAVKFTEHGSVELRIAADDGYTIFSIRDTGIGMADEAINRLFKPFAQADDSITRKYGGTGLGLMISKELVEAMGGTIDVESAAGVGTCFWISLPLEAAERAADAPVTVSGPDAPVAALIGGRVLLVDDNQVNQQLGAAMLERLQLPFDIAENGAVAVERVARTDYALVLMDMEMPLMDGLSATREIRQREQLRGDQRRLTIIAMTANALSEDRDRCFEAGMDGYVAKPIRRSTLESEIFRLFGTDSVPVCDTPVSPVNTAVAATAPAVFDRAQAIELMGDEALFTDLAGMYVDGADDSLRELDAALAAQNWTDLKRSAHSIKGLFATFAAHAGEADARELEHAAAAADATRCNALAPTVRRHVEALAQALRQ